MSVISLGALLVISVSNPKDNLFSSQMFLGVIGFTGVLVVLFVIWNKLGPVISKIRWLFPILTVFFGISLYIVSCIGRNDPASSDDYNRVWNAAYSLAIGEEIEDAYYLLNYSNNIKPMLFLYLIFKLTFIINAEDPYYIILAINVLGVMASVWGIYNILDNERNKGKYWISIIGFFVGCLPIWAMTQTFYTDAMSIWIAVVILALCKKVLVSEKNKAKIIMCIVIGLLLTLGISIKVTILIPLIAAVIVYLFIRNNCLQHQIIKYFICILLSFLISYIVLGAWTNTFEITKMSKLTEDPVITWVGLGLKGDGSYHENTDYIFNVHAFETKAEKTAYCKAYIKENFHYFFDLKHIISKIRCTYASGHLGSAEFSFIAHNKDNILWQLFSPWGKFYWRTSQLGFCYLHALFCICFVGNMITIYRFTKYKKFSKSLMIVDLTMLGYFIFLLIWEANNRQLYNMLPILIGAAILNGFQLVEFFESAKIVARNRKA